MEAAAHDIPGDLQLLTGASLAYYVLNTAPMALGISFAEEQRFGEVWHNCYFQSFPFYLAGASVAWFVSLLTSRAHWPGMVQPCSCRSYF